MSNLIELRELQSARPTRAWCQMPEGLRQFLYAKYMIRDTEVAPAGGTAHLGRVRIAATGGRHA